MCPHHETASPHRLGRIALAALLTAGLTPALAAEESPTRTRFGFDAGGVSPSQNFHTFIGINAGRHTSADATWNTFVGTNAGYNNLGGSRNTFMGVNAGYSNVTGTALTFIGESAGRSTTGTVGSTFVGTEAGFSNTTGAFNSFFGHFSGRSNTTGRFNTFIGRDAGYANATAEGNTFVGARAGVANTTGSPNSFFGMDAGFANTTGTHNAFLGYRSGYSNSIGSTNTFVGDSSGLRNTSGTANTFLGRSAGSNNTAGGLNTFVGLGAGLGNTTGVRNTTAGAFANVSAGLSNATAVGWQAQASQSDSLVLGSVPGVNTSQGPNRYVAVGMGTDEPAAPLHVRRDRTSTAELALLENASGTAANRVMLEMVNNGGTSVNFTNSATSQTWALRAGVNGANVFDLYRVGGSLLVRVNGAGNMTLAGTLTQNSNVHDKTGIEVVDAQAVLGKLQALPIRRWRYKADEGSAHVGPMAQDFHAAFGLGADATKIAPGDMAGVALVAIQAQQQRMKSQDERLARLEAENEALRAQLRVLAATVGTPARR